MNLIKGFRGSWKNYVFLACIWLDILLVSANSLSDELAEENHGDVSLMVILVLLNAFIVALFAFLAGVKFRNIDD